MKYFLAILPLILMLALVAVAIIYLSNRFTLYFPAVSNKLWAFIFVASIVFSFLAILLPIFPQNFVGTIICFAGSSLLAVIFFLLIFVGLTDLASLFVKMSPVFRGIASLLLATTVTAYGMINATDLRSKEITVPIAGLTKEIKAVYITDVHLGNLWSKKHLEKIVDKAVEFDPDVIFNTGDMFDNKSHFNENSDILNSLTKINVPHYFVYGNHDYDAGLDEALAFMKNAGVIVLRNEISYFDELQIIGLDNMLPDENSFNMHTKQGAETIKTIMEKLPINENLPTIALHHRPEGVKYMSDKKVDLLLAGHTHAGQMFPFTLLTNALFPYNKGLYKYGDMSIYVSAGAGTFGPPVRIGTKSEITFVRLVPAD